MALEAVHELKVETNGDAVADVAFRFRISVTDGAQSAMVRVAARFIRSLAAGAT